MRSRAKEIVRCLLAEANILLDGKRPWDIRVLNDAFYERLLAGGSLAAGDAFVEGWWEAAKLDEFSYRIFMADLHERFGDDLRTKIEIYSARFFDRRGVPRAREEARPPRTLSNDVLRAMLGKRMIYACGYWDGARCLDEAEEAKLELICDKLELKAGMTVLELGCGWGGFAKYAAEKHGVGVVGISTSEEQIRLGRELCAGLPIDLRVQDYRQVRGQFDRVVSIGIMEHFGPKNFRAYMELAASCLKNDGIAFIHTIARNSAYRRDPWFDWRIFPNGEAPSFAQLAAAMEGLFVLEDCHNIGPHYAPTLMAWHDNLVRAWPGLAATYGERFFRMMKYHLLSTAGFFRARRNQVLQLVMTKPGRRQPVCRPSRRLESVAREPLKESNDAVPLSG